jgi:hypothetical protein
LKGYRAVSFGDVELGQFDDGLHPFASQTDTSGPATLGGLSLADALELTLLMRETDRWRYERAAVRWLERFIEERRPSLAELALASAGPSQIGGAGDGSLRKLLRSTSRRAAQGEDQGVTLRDR